MDGGERELKRVEEESEKILDLEAKNQNCRLQGKK